MMRSPFFFFGSLQDEGVFEAVVDESARAEAEICMSEFYGRVGRHELDRHWPEIERRAAAVLARRQDEDGALAS